MISLANIPLLHLFSASSLPTGKKKIFNENEFCLYFWISELFYQVCIQPLQSYYTFFTSHMGADCAPCVSVKKDPRMASGDHSNYPDDLHTYESQSRQNLAKIKFNGLLYNIKIINWAKNAVSLKFQIPGVTQVLLPRKTKQSDINEIKWVLKQNFDFIVDEYQLRLKFLHITVTDDSNKIIQNLKINLYKIATGPYHNDFSICGSKYNTRLQFDLKLSQYVQMNIDCEQTEAEICKKQYPGQSFYFTIRVLREEKQQPFQSTPSYKHSKPYLDTKKSQIVNSKYDQCPSPIRIRGKAPPKVTKNSSSFFWSSEKGDLPHFKIYLKSSEIQKTILHLVIWRTQSQIDIDDDSNTSSQDEDMFCEAYTPITRILQKDPVFRSDSSRNLKIEERVISLQKQGLWSDGQKIGEFSMKLKIQNNIFIKQMKACARTQSGIVLSIPFFGTYGINGKNEKNTVRFAQVKQIMVKIQNLNKQLNQNKKLSSQNTQKIKLSMSEQFNKMKKFFEDDEENSYFVPNNQSEALKMMDDQSLLLSVIQQIFYFIEDDQSLTDICWRIILAIIRRGQFNLNNIGFNKNDLNEIKKGVSSFYQKKIKIGLQYQELFFKLLVKSLRTGYIQGRQDPRQPIQMFRALSYFRVPEYREVLLRKVVRNQDFTIEWNTNITDGDIQNLPEAEHMLLTQLDWQNYFYKPLETQKRSQSLIKQLVENIEGSLWLQQISKRGSTFFYFLYFLIFRLLELSKRIKFIKWQYFPGYNKLVRAFLFEMKNLKVERYPQSLIQTSINLLANEKLLNILVLIVFQKTNSNDCNGLMKGLDLISRYLNHFTKNKKLLPPTFNYVYFFKGIKIVIEGEFSFSIVKVLSIIFMNYQNFNVEFKKNLSLYLLGRSFFKLFLNWSFTIRNAFYHLLLLKIQRSTDIFDPESRKQFANKHQLMNQIKERYDQCFKILRNASRVENDNNIEFVKKHEKQLYKVLKRKLAIKKKNIMSNSTQKKKHNLKLHSLLVKRQSLKNGLSDKKVTNKYSLHQLMKNGQSERTYSMHVDSTVLKSCKQSFKLNYDNDEKQSKQSKQSFHDSSRTKSDAYHNLDTEDWKDLNIKKTKKVRERKRSIFGNDDFDMREIDKKELQYLPIAIKQFDELDQAIRNYYIEKGTLPICELDIEVPIDQKEIKPDSADFEDWQSGLED